MKWKLLVAAWEAPSEERPRTCTQSQDKTGDGSNYCSRGRRICFAWASQEERSQEEISRGSWKEASPPLSLIFTCYLYRYIYTCIHIHVCVCTDVYDLFVRVCMMWACTYYFWIIDLFVYIYSCTLHLHSSRNQFYNIYCLL